MVIIASFTYVAAQRLESFPLPRTDESYTLQVPYEMNNRGSLSLPMYRYLGGNIENVWHSYTPLYFVLLGSYLKVFGWGLLQGRSFNLLTAVLVLVMIYVVGSKLFDWRVGSLAVLLMTADSTFLDQSRLLRNDFAA